MQHNRLSSWCKGIATQGAIGYTQAPGTVATIMSIPLLYFLKHLHMSQSLYLAISMIGLCCGLMIVHKALPYFNESDPSEIVIDEMIGFLFVFIAVDWHWITLLLGFVLFRLIDIYKPFGISFIERLHGAWGIMLDDVAAGLLVNFVLQMLHYYYWLA